MVRLTVLFALLAGSSVAAEPAGRGEQPHVLVLKNGRILVGQIRLVDDSYQVVANGRRVVVSRKLVEVEATGLVDAHRRLRAAMPEPTAARHVLLAEWCLAYGLKTQAAGELRDALKLAPGHLAARRLLERLGFRKQSRADAPTPKKAVAAMRRDAVAVEALGGLPRDVAAEYVSRVQPLLINRCGNAGCHSSASGNGFRIRRIRRGSSGHRVLTRRNLASVLQQLDLKTPAASPLLVRPRGKHGSSRRAIFSGVGGAGQAALLKAWVERVAAGQGPAARKLTARPAATRFGAEPASDPLAAVAKPTRQDVFDPEIFNRETRRRLEAALARRKPRKRVPR